MLCLCTNTSGKWKKLDLGSLDNLLRFFIEEKSFQLQVPYSFAKSKIITERREKLSFASLL